MAVDLEAVSSLLQIFTQQLYDLSKIWKNNLRIYCTIETVYAWTWTFQSFFFILVANVSIGMLICIFGGSFKETK